MPILCGEFSLGWTLDHETVDDAVENRAVVERTFIGTGSVRLGILLRAPSQADEVSHGLRGVVSEQFDGDIAVVGVQNCGCSLVTHSEPLYGKLTIAYIRPGLYAQ